LKRKVFLAVFVSLFLLSNMSGIAVNTSEAVSAGVSHSAHQEVAGGIGSEFAQDSNKTIEGNVQEAYQTLQFSSTSNSASFASHIMCKGHDSEYNPIEPTTIFTPNDAKAECLTNVIIDNMIEFRWYYRSNSSKTWISCYNWSRQEDIPGEYFEWGYLDIDGYWPGIYYPRAYEVDVYLDGFYSFSEFFEITNGGLNSPRICEEIDANGQPVNMKSRFTIGTDTKAYYYLRFDKIAYFNEELKCCHNFTTVWIQPNGSTYKTYSGNFTDYKDTNITLNYWAYQYASYDYISINSSTPVGNWKVELYLDSYFNTIWTSYGPVTTTDFVVGNETVADWTFMVYLDADIDNQTNTEDAGIATFLKLAKIGSSPPKVNVVIQMDRMSGQGDYGNWTDCKRFYVTKDMTPTSENAVEDLTEVNMGNPDTLRDFVNWAASKYPANYYCLVLWDHGAGIMGLCLDYTPTPTDCLSLPELSQALSGLPMILDIVVIDACSMGMTEIAYQIKDCSNVLVSPEGLGYAPAPYDYYLSRLTSVSSMSPNTFAKEIVTDYIAWCNSIDEINEATMSATDLTKITILTAAIDCFATKLKEKETPYHEQISLAKNQTEGYPGPYADQTGYYIDLYHFTQLTRQYVQDKELQYAADQVMTALSVGNTIIKEDDKAHPNSHGLAIFFPNSKDKYDECKDVYKETAFAADIIWSKFVEYDVSGYVLTIQIPYPETPIRVDKDLFISDAYGRIYLFSLPAYHTINITTPILTDLESRRVFTQWNDGSTSNPRILFVSGTLVLEAQYKIQYRLVVNATSGTTHPSVGEYWYDVNSVVRVDAIASNVTSDKQYTFDHWSIDGISKEFGVDSIWITMDGPHEAIAYYAIVVAWWENLLNPQVQIVLGLASLFLAVVLTRAVWIRTSKRKIAMKSPIGRATIEAQEVLPGRVATGHVDVDNLLFGGIPENNAIILTSPSCDERDSLIRRFLKTGIENNETTFHVTTDPSETKSFAEEFQSTFHLCICNPRADAMIQNLSNVSKLNGVENLTEIIIALTKAFQGLSISATSPRRACIEIIPDVLLRHHAVQTRRWLADLITEMKSRGFTVLAVINPQMHPPEEVHAILDLFDGEINIREEETQKGIEKHLKIKRMTGHKYLDNELFLRKDDSQR
jgi:KaiC/GvpD/RAD55 family RecA-like ATPase